MRNRAGEVPIETRRAVQNNIYFFMFLFSIIIKRTSSIITDVRSVRNERRRVNVKTIILIFDSLLIYEFLMNLHCLF